jgi:hypothetical protein
MPSTYLTKTFSGGSNSNKNFTISFWFKGSSHDRSDDENLYLSYYDSSNRFGIGIDGNDRLKIENNAGGTYTMRFITNRRFRDVNSWYHLVCRAETNASAQADRFKIYINGVQETSFNVATYIPQNNPINMPNSSYPTTIGAWNGGSQSWNGSMSHFHICDGYSYDASYFGETDSTTGEWKIKTSPSVSYGTNGFWILKDGNSVTDSSSNSNDYTVSGGTLTKTEDNPSCVFSTLNPLVKPNDYTLSQGNNTIAYGSASTRACCLSTLGMSSGKFYAELKVTATSTTPCQASVGIANDSDNTNSGYYPSQGNTDNAASYQFWDGSKNIGSSGATYGNTVAANDIMGFAFDIDNKAMYVSKNGVWQGGGVPTSGASKTNAIDFSSITDNGFWFLIVGDGSGVQTFTSSFNFGNGYFGSTQISSAGTNASGNGIFEYDVPTGYTALSTKGLNL